MTEVTIKNPFGYTVADIDVKGWLWGSKPIASVTIKPRDGSPSVSFDIGVNDWMILSGEVINALVSETMKLK